ncbi:uncharacterized protein LOC62_07G009481 [Vanrija pseudolonga]|uniref:Zn(2)-C6 fungal-type domain-containing protein n=1 Tax=Vanrija pseudolonga TaxID=143232 RepID=A0AAF1BUF2_9TREE|nr:hypothetical protein LOC62_07G009481 [Vanrija pseudolonga]
MSALQSTTPRADQPARKRKRRTRTKTGCRECRRQHVKCNEGAILPSGRKVACRRCWETDQACFYPFPANGYPASSNGKVVKRAKGDPAPEKTVPDITWERAEDVSEWVGKGDDDEDGDNDTVLAAGPSTSPPVMPPAPSMALPLSMALFAPQSELFDPAVHLPSSPARRAKAHDPATLSPLTPLDSLPLPRSMAAPAWTSVRPAMLRDPMHESSAPVMLRHATTAAAAAASAAAMRDANGSTHTAMVRQLDAAPVPVPPQFMHAHTLIAPPKVIASYTLASLSTSDADRATVSYFELQGCNEVTCVSSHRDNWIFTQLFPRLFQSLSTSSSGPSTPASAVSSNGTPTLRAWLHHSLLHLAYVHRGNVEKDALQSAFFLTQAREHRDRATTALFKAKVLGAEFRSDDYLIGVFLRCMGEILDSGRVQVDATAVLALKSAASSPFHDTLRDLINVYAAIQAACAPATAADALPALEIEEHVQGAEWTERTFGCSRHTVKLMARVSSMVARRAVLLQSGADGSAPGLLLKAEAEALAHDLGDAWDWDERNVAPGSSDRVQRGNLIMRYALRTMLLCEILDTDLADERITSARMRACELVADCDPAKMTGFQWEMTVLAVYTRDPSERVRVRSLIRLALDMSFGPQYRGALDVLDVCWEVLDARGCYENGVAPWREAMAALGRNLWF